MFCADALYMIFEKQHTYSLQGVYQLPPPVTTLCCSNFVPLPPDPPPFLLLFGRLKSIKKCPIKMRVLPALVIPAVGQLTLLHLPKKGKKRIISADPLSVQALKCCTTGSSSQLCEHAFYAISSCHSFIKSLMLVNKSIAYLLRQLNITQSPYGLHPAEIYCLYLILIFLEEQKKKNLFPVLFKLSR